MNQDLVKIVLVSSESGGEEPYVEALWAEDLGQNNYRLRNYPFYYYGVSFGDIVEAYPNKLNEGDQRPYFVKIIEKSGNKTLRVIFSAKMIDDGDKEIILEILEAMGCGYEYVNQNYFAINIGPKIDFMQVCNYLTLSEVEWEHADPTYEEINSK